MAMLFCGLCCMGAAAADQAREELKQLYRKNLAQETQIQGYTCAKGNAWFYADGRLQQCAVPRDTDFGVAYIPAGSWINLLEDGRPDFVFLAHDTEIAGNRCSGGNWLLGPREGAMTGFYPNGKLKYCWLTGDQDVQGIPCAHSGMFTGDSSVKFYQSGRVHSCKLSRDYAGFMRGQRFSQ